MPGTITTELDELYPPTPAVDTILGEADDEGVHAVDIIHVGASDEVYAIDAIIAETNDEGVHVADMLYGETVTRPLATEDDMIVETEDSRYIIDMQWPHDYTANFIENVNTVQENPCGCHGH